MVWYETIPPTLHGMVWYESDPPTALILPSSALDSQLAPSLPHRSGYMEPPSLSPPHLILTHLTGFLNTTVPLPYVPKLLCVSHLWSYPVNYANYRILVDSVKQGHLD